MARKVEHVQSTEPRAVPIPLKVRTEPKSTKQKRHPQCATRRDELFTHCALNRRHSYKERAPAAVLLMYSSTNWPCARSVADVRNLDLYRPERLESVLHVLKFATLLGKSRRGASRVYLGNNDIEPTQLFKMLRVLNSADTRHTSSTGQERYPARRQDTDDKFDNRSAADRHA